MTSVRSRSGLSLPDTYYICDRTTDDIVGKVRLVSVSDETGYGYDYKTGEPIRLTPFEEYLNTGQIVDGPCSA